MPARSAAIALVANELASRAEPEHAIGLPGVSVAIRQKASARTRKPIEVHLPVIDAAATASAALRLMRQHARSGVIAHQGGRSWLYAAPQIVVAIADNPTVRLKDIQPAVELELHRKPEPPPAAVGPLPSTTPATKRLMAALSSKAAARRVAFALGPRLIRTLDAGPRDCYCSVDGEPVADGHPGNDCPSGHRGSVRCV
jgi:hypothetical protein